MGCSVKQKIAKVGVTTFVVVLGAIGAHHYWYAKTLTPILEISTGKLQGSESLSRGGIKINEYKGIPYAKQPVADLRFEPPQPADKWLGVLDATATGSQCLQVNLIRGNVEGSEECLFINVYTPASRNGPLPVMVWFHGGAFVFGTSSRYYPAYLLDQDVILVTANYRLASLGFFNSGDGVVRGNQGLKDQTMALKWVQANIKYFGGDPNQVTIFGESAGSASVGFHLVSPMSTGLFHRAMMQSGSPLGNWALNKEPGKQAKRFAAKFNCTITDTTEMVACLKKVDAYTLVKAHQEMLLPLREKITLFVPTIETVQDDKTFIGADPFDLLMSGRVNKVPLVIGVNAEEGLLSSSIITANETKLRQANDEWDFFAPRILGYDPSNKAVSEKIRQYYFPEIKDIASIEYISSYTNMFSDRMFFVPVHNFVKEFMKHAPTRLYLYSYSGEWSLGDVLAATQSERLPVIVSVLWEVARRWVSNRVLRHTIPHLGVCHGDELQLIFNLPMSSFIHETHKDYEMSLKMVKLWTDFAKGSKKLTVDNIDWPAVQNKSTEPFQYLNIADKFEIINEPFTNRVEFWDSIGV